MTNPVDRQSDQNPCEGGETSAAERAVWVTALYNELRALAQSELESERRNHTLSATALVNEAYIKLGPAAAGAAGPPIDRGAFFGLAAQAMRRILVDHARAKRRQKRGGGRPVAGGESLGLVADPEQDGSPLDAVALDEALERLELEHAEAARVVELRFFAGLTELEIARIMQLNDRTVRRHWTFAKAWLAREMHPDPTGEDRAGGTA